MSSKLILILKLEVIKRSKINMGNNITNCFIKKTKGYIKWSVIFKLLVPLKGSPKDLNKAYSILLELFSKRKYKWGESTKRKNNRDRKYL